ncbi:MAG: tRNA (5-methylaminomethyl-2-thiouridine)(34)-methyltransferase MnmD [Paramuribaculum sp.]|nr:tRNA (5-methylaminomethyl-2-thiouridine)(34)-methyltransferase MnmD [Paramuribaculum sp.]
MSTPVNPTIETTADGSVTLYLTDIDEHYHSTKGALTESRHIYIDLGWRNHNSTKSPVKVFEVGFGTGLNAALTALAAIEAQSDTDYISVELHPISHELTAALFDYQHPQYAEEYRKVNSCPWNTTTRISPYFRLTKLTDNLLTMELPAEIDVVYFDAFAPEKQPEMWTRDIFYKLYQSMTPGGILTTYCSKGAIRRMLQEIGFTTERLEGPPGGKREVLRATKPL